MDLIYENIRVICIAAIILGAVVLIASIVMGIVTGNFMTIPRITSIVGGLIMVGLGILGIIKDNN